jgi:hypothetical protein
MQNLQIKKNLRMNYFCNKLYKFIKTKKIDPHNHTIVIVDIDSNFINQFVANPNQIPIWFKIVPMINSPVKCVVLLNVLSKIVYMLQKNSDN